jgi:hypothetical protein
LAGIATLYNMMGDANDNRWRQPSPGRKISEGSPVAALCHTLFSAYSYPDFQIGNRKTGETSRLEAVKK